MSLIPLEEAIEPSVTPSPICSVPPLMIVGPVYEFKLVRVSAPGPVCVRPPLPLMAGLKLTESL